jgi:hypothetical protein
MNEEKICAGESYMMDWRDENCLDENPEGKRPLRKLTRVQGQY